MNLNTIYSNNNSFRTTVARQYRNSADIEKSSTAETYTNPELSKYFDTTNNIQIRTNVLMNKYYEKIKSKATKKQLSKELNIKYRFRPELLASDEFGIPGLWYLILKLNGCEDFSEFHDLPYVLLPSIDVLNECLVNEEYILGKESL